LETGFDEKHYIDYDCSVPLFDYQREAIEKVFSKHYGILQAPAGSGKTQMGIALIAKFGCRSLWLTHTQPLLQQSKKRALLYMDKTLLGEITDGKINIGRGCTFSTVQTMCRIDLDRYKDYWDVIIVDECHRVAGTPTAMTMFSKVLNSLSARHKIGLSATVHRSDGLIVATHALLGEIVHTVPEEAVGDRIVKVGIEPIGTGVEVSRACLNTDGTLNYAKLISYLCESRERNAVILDAILQNGRRPCLILSDRLNHLEFLMKSLPLTERSGAVMISGLMTSKKGKAEREQAIEDMRTGRKNLLFATYALAKEGLDIPRLERLFMVSPVKDFAVVIQSVGRIARTCDGKVDPIAYDFVDNIQYCVKA
jgi:superfamily II DNA or RNA helicase